MARHYSKELAANAKFANARIDALQASVAVIVADVTRAPEAKVLDAFQNMDRQIAAQWEAISEAIENG